MGEHSAIAWTDATFNPWWGCTQISEACRNCYAARFARRVSLDVFGADSPRRFFSDRHWNEPRVWARKAARNGVRYRVFCGSMCDLFELRADLEPHRQRLWKLIRETSDSLDWLLLTKRAANLRFMLPEDVARVSWVGVTVENTARLGRLTYLSGVKARARFVSLEPLMESVDLTPYMSMLDLVIVGGESGPGFRQFNPDWVRALRDQTQPAGVCLFYKQASGLRPEHTPELDGQRWTQLPTVRL